MEENEEEENGDSMFSEYGDTTMEDNEEEDEEEEEEEEGEEQASGELADDLGQNIADARRDCETQKERDKFDQMLEDHKTALYPDCEDDLKKLGTTLEFLKWKAEFGCPDSGFEKLLNTSPFPGIRCLRILSGKLNPWISTKPLFYSLTINPPKKIYKTMILLHQNLIS